MLLCLLTALDDKSSPTISNATPDDDRSKASSPKVASHSGHDSVDLGSDTDEAWDARRLFMRDSMDSGAQQMKMAHYVGKSANQSSSPNKRVSRNNNERSAVMTTQMAELREEENSGGSTKTTQMSISDGPETPLVPPRRTASLETPLHSESPVGDGGDGSFHGRSVATELRLRIQRARERDTSPADPASTPKSSFRVTMHEDVEPEEFHVNMVEPQANSYSKEQARDVDDGEGETSQISSDDSHHTDQNSQESEFSVNIQTPHPVNEEVFTAPSPPTIHEALLASPLPPDDGWEATTKIEPGSPSNLVPPHPPTWSPSHLPDIPLAPWAPGSPASPHSIAATQQAVEAVRRTPEAKRPRGMTLVGRIEADLSAAKGPVPITFLVGGPSLGSPNIGMGLPSGMGRTTPDQGRSTTPTNAGAQTPDEKRTILDAASRFPPLPVRSVTSPGFVPQVPVTASPAPKPVSIPMRPRSRSFSAIIKSLGKGRKESTPPLAIDTSNAPPVPNIITPESGKRSFFSKASPSTPGSPAQLPLSRSTTVTSMTETLPPPSSFRMHSSDSNPSLAPQSGRSSSFSFSSKSSKTPRKTSTSRTLPSPVSHRDYEETVQADGMDFELVKPTLETPTYNRTTMASGSSSGSLRAPLPETDEWGFLKEKSPTPEIFQSRSAPGDHRVAEQKWVRI